jgi:hypothetical protein
MNGGTNPPPPPAPARVRLSVVATTLTAPGDCENVTQGRGDFAYRIIAEALEGVSSTATTRTVRQSSGYPSANGVIQLGTGESFSLGATTAFEPLERAGSFLLVQFDATEWDKDLLQRDIVDSRMNGQSGNQRFDWTETRGWNGGVGTHTITLGGGACAIRLTYRIDRTPLS